MAKCIILALALALASATAQAQVVFNQDFDGGYSGAFGTSSYQGGSPALTTNFISAGFGNPNSGWVAAMITTTWGDYYGGQLQLMTVSGNTDPVAANYTLSFDAKGSAAANIQLGIQSWQNNYFGGSMIGSATVNQTLAVADQWQTFNINIGSLSGFNPTGATWQLNFQLNSWEWGGPGNVDGLFIDNIKLTVVPEPSVLALAGLGTVALLRLRRRRN
jgi:hypothetical protein